MTPTNGSSDLPMAAVNDPSQFVVSPIEDSVTPMNFYGNFQMPDVNNSFLFVGSPFEDSLLVPMDAYGHFSILADVNDLALQYVGSPIVTPMNVSGDYSMADVISNNLWNSY